VRVEDLVPFATGSDPSLHDITYPNGDRVHGFGVCFATTRWSGRLAPDLDEALQAAFHGSLPPGRQTTVDATLSQWRAYQATGRFQLG
jgi:hypothetical protein